MWMIAVLDSHVNYYKCAAMSMKAAIPFDLDSRNNLNTRMHMILCAATALSLLPTPLDSRAALQCSICVTSLKSRQYCPGEQSMGPSRQFWR